MNKLTIDQLRQLADRSLGIETPVPPECKGVETAYYGFLYLLAQMVEPNLIVELGTGREARSAAHFAAGAPKARVIGIDFQPPDFIPYPNIEWWTGDIRLMSQRVAEIGIPADLIFLDSTHESSHALVEFNLYWPLLRPGGILLVDDLNLGDMRTFWETVPEPKFEHVELHGNCGFGIAIKNGNSQP